MVNTTYDLNILNNSFEKVFCKVVARTERVTKKCCIEKILRDDARTHRPTRGSWNNDRFVRQDLCIALNRTFKTCAFRRWLVLSQCNCLQKFNM